MMKLVRALLLACTSLTAAQAHAADEADASSQPNDDIIVIGQNRISASSTKTDTPSLEVPQPVTVISADLFQEQGAISINDTLRYVAGVTANPYGPDSRTDGATVRGSSVLQFRDGMRDIFSYYASIRADPYNFAQVELVRGPASVLFGQGALGGILNLVSKVPQYEAGGEVAVRYGSFDRKEALADLTGPIADTLAGRIVALARDSGTQTDHVDDDRILLSPSLRWAPSADTDLTLLGLYQEDDSGSTSQFLPVVGTILPNPNGRLPNDLFVGKPGWDRYDGRLLQGTGIFNHRFSDAVKLSLKARYIDSDLSYFTHYADSYSNPLNPYVLLNPATGTPVYDPETELPLPDPEQRTIGLYIDASEARMEIFSTDNNVQFNFNTGEQVEHTLLAGVDYSWNHVRKIGAFGIDYIDIYDIDYDALFDFGGGLPPGAAPSEDVEQEQLGFYVQDQVRFYDRVSIVLGAHRDKVTSTNALSAGGPLDEEWNATTFRAGIIGEVVGGVSPFFSYTESFEPISGVASDGGAFRPKQGNQYEIGVKIHPTDALLVTLTGYRIKEDGRPIDDPSTPDPFDQMQAGSLTSEGFEAEANAALPGDFRVIAAYSYNKAEIDGTDVQLDNVPKHNASLWTTKSLPLSDDVRLTLGGGVRYVGANYSYGPAFPDGLRTPSYTLFDALAEVEWQDWSFRLNATNLFNKEHYSACLARGDCFMGAERNVYGTLSYRF